MEQTEKLTIPQLVKKLPALYGNPENVCYCFRNIHDDSVP